LQEISHDKHLRVRYSSRALPPESANHEPTPEEEAQFRDMMRVTNCGFEKVERLPGNVGYVEFRQFAPPSICADTAAAAMNFLANADALIVDLRRNGGGGSADIELSLRRRAGPSERLVFQSGQQHAPVVDAAVCSGQTLRTKQASICADIKPDILGS